MDCTATTSSPLPRLPVEIIEQVSECLFELVPPAPEETGDTPLYCAKPLWRTVAGFMAASVELHRMGLARWLRTITIKEPGDWDIISPHIKLIREIKCLDGTLLNNHNHKVLLRIPNLYSATIDAHSDVWHDENDRFVYRDIVTALPPSLKRLEVMHAHGPDVKVIATVKNYCPQIEVLRLSRCTMFNRIPACNFWAAFPHDHDAYISDTGIDTYAHSLGSELAPLKGLRSLRMGLYLVPSDTVLAHRLYHRRGRDAPQIIDWQTAIPLSELAFGPFVGEHNVDPGTVDQLISTLHQLDSQPGEGFHCIRCVGVTAEKTQRAEWSASAILREHIPLLVNVEWMSWLSPGHLGVNIFQFSSDV